MYQPVMFDHDPPKQQIFDAVIAHLAKQKRQCTALVNGKTSCRYRAAKGRMCAIGALIPNELYRPEYEYRDILFLVDNYGHLPEWFQEHKLLLSDLQNAHDSAGDANDLRQELKVVAHNWWLDDASVECITEFDCTH